MRAHVCACARVSPICKFTNIRVTVMLSCGFTNPLALPWQHLNLHFISDYCMCGLDKHSAGLRTIYWKLILPIVLFMCDSVFVFFDLFMGSGLLGRFILKLQFHFSVSR